MHGIEYNKILEALLFASGDAVPVARLAEATEIDIPAVRGILADMAEKYKNENSGIILIEVNDAYQLCTNPIYHDYAKRLVPETVKRTLTQALLETLAIIDHMQPVTKTIIEEIRGVNADHAVSKLTEYGLVEEKGRLDAPGRPILFGTTDDFLRYFGLRSVDDFMDLINEQQSAVNFNVNLENHIPTV